MISMFLKIIIASIIPAQYASDVFSFYDNAPEAAPHAGDALKPAALFAYRSSQMSRALMIMAVGE